jgi:hypothetical protein
MTRERPKAGVAARALVAAGRRRLDRAAAAFLGFSGISDRPGGPHEQLGAMSQRSLMARWLPRGRVARRSRGLLLGGVWLRCRTWRRADDLDQELACGADPMQTDELSLRVGQLGSAATRVRLARALRGAVELANGRRAPLITTRLRRAEIREIDELLISLADRIRDGEPLGVQGLAMTARLLNERSSPLYRSGVSGSLRATVAKTLAALERGQRTAGTIATSW